MARVDTSFGGGVLRGRAAGAPPEEGERIRLATRAPLDLYFLPNGRRRHWRLAALPLVDCPEDVAKSIRKEFARARLAQARIVEKQNQLRSLRRSLAERATPYIVRALRATYEPPKPKRRLSVLDGDVALSYDALIRQATACVPDVAPVKENNQEDRCGRYIMYAPERPKPKPVAIPVPTRSVPDRRDAIAEQVRFSNALVFVGVVLGLAAAFVYSFR
jgi:hypothetical protein